jgi:hypothetical protein
VVIKNFEIGRQPIKDFGPLTRDEPGFLKISVSKVWLRIEIWDSRRIVNYDHGTRACKSKDLVELQNTVIHAWNRVVEIDIPAIEVDQIR